MGRGKAGARGARDAATSEESVHPRKIFVGGLAHRTCTQTLKEYFSKYGEVSDAVVLRWPEDGKSRGFGYVTFANASVASKMVHMVNEGERHHIHGHVVDVKPAVPGTNKVFVGGLPQSTTTEDLRNLFSNFGEVSDSVVMRDPGNKARSRGFGFVCFVPGSAGKAAVEAAIARYDHHYIRGKWIEVKTAQPPRKLVEEVKSARPPRKSFDEVEKPSAPEGTMPSVKKGPAKVKQEKSMHKLNEQLQAKKEVAVQVPLGEKVVAGVKMEGGKKKVSKTALVLHELVAAGYKFPQATDSAESTAASDASSDSEAQLTTPSSPLEPMKIAINSTWCFGSFA